MIPEWLDSVAKFLASGAVLASLIPIVIKVLTGLISSQSRQSIILKFPDDKTVSIENTKLSEESIQKILEKFKTAEGKGEAHE